jgi:D-3-phosphoglycerate dehydrogenase
VVSPHLGASTEEAQLNVAVEISQQVADALMGRGIRNAVNIPYIEFEVWKVIKPYILLAEKMGALQTQLLPDPIEEVNITYAGDIIKHNTNPMTVAFMRGLLNPAVGEMVNYVNAAVIAKERGIKVTDSKTSQMEEFANLISVTVKTKSEKLTIAGSLFANNQPRIVKIDNYYVDAIPEGYMIFISNKDVPGIVGQIGMLLGKNNINIAAMTFGREKPGGKAISVCNVDSEVSDKILQEIRKSDNIYGARLIKL